VPYAEQFLVNAPAEGTRPPSAGTRPRAESRVPRALSIAPFPVDPICGMPVNPADARHTLVVGEETLYFCCPHCKATYERRRPESAQGPEARA
jgi:YHS domain-containing protein